MAVPPPDRSPPSPSAVASAQPQAAGLPISGIGTSAEKIKSRISYETRLQNALTLLTPQEQKQRLQQAVQIILGLSPLPMIEAQINKTLLDKSVSVAQRCNLGMLKLALIQAQVQMLKMRNQFTKLESLTNVRENWDAISSANKAIKTALHATITMLMEYFTQLNHLQLSPDSFRPELSESQKLLSPLNLKIKNARKALQTEKDAFREVANRELRLAEYLSLPRVQSAIIKSYQTLGEQTVSTLLQTTLAHCLSELKKPHTAPSTSILEVLAPTEADVTVTKAAVSVAAALRAKSLSLMSSSSSSATSSPSTVSPAPSELETPSAPSTATSSPFSQSQQSEELSEPEQSAGQQKEKMDLRVAHKTRLQQALEEIPANLQLEKLALSIKIIFGLTSFPYSEASINAQLNPIRQEVTAEHFNLLSLKAHLVLAQGQLLKLRTSYAAMLTAEPFKLIMAERSFKNTLLFLLTSMMEYFAKAHHLEQHRAVYPRGLTEEEKDLTELAFRVGSVRRALKKEKALFVENVAQEGQLADFLTRSEIVNAMTSIFTAAPIPLNALENTILTSLSACQFELAERQLNPRPVSLMERLTPSLLKEEGLLPRRRGKTKRTATPTTPSSSVASHAQASPAPDTKRMRQTPSFSAASASERLASFVPPSFLPAQTNTPLTPTPFASNTTGHAVRALSAQDIEYLSQQILRFEPAYPSHEQIPATQAADTQAEQASAIYNEEELNEVLDRLFEQENT